MKNRKPLLLVLVLLVLVGLVAVAPCCFCGFVSFLRPLLRNPSQLIGQPAPDFTLNDLEGDDVSLSDFRGRVVLLNFWSSG